MAKSRRVLFLLGPPSLLWRELAEGFENEGHAVFKIHFSLGDQIFWWRKGGHCYRGRRRSFRNYLDDFVTRNDITDILYYGDRDFYHVVAQEVANERGLRAISIENGYLRPDWITLERGGMGTGSHFPADPDVIRALAREMPAPNLDTTYKHSFSHEITFEIFYSMISYFWRIFYPFYRFDRYYDPLLEYILAIPHVVGRSRRQYLANKTIESIEANHSPCFVVALQLQGDQQIRANSPYVHLSGFIADVVASFAGHAQTDHLLIFKQHPHDNNREGWARIVFDAARVHGIEDRVRFIDGGDLEKLLRQAKGCVVVNSTVGILSLRLGCPTKVMGVAIYDIEGLTHAGKLDDFWRQPQPVDAKLSESFVRVLAATIQVKGSFFNREGRRAAVKAILARISADAVNQPGAFVDPPPRLSDVRAIKVTST